VNELSLIDRIRARAGAPGRRVLAGIGDDCAIYRPHPGRDLLFTTDLLLEDVHFRADTHPPGAVGWRALARGLSDIAAMGGEPEFCLLSLALAAWTDTRWLDRFLSGFLKLARRTNTTLAGGDLSRGARVACDILVCGSVPKGKALRRDGARAGDAIYVSGPLGGAALGLKKRRGAAWKKHAYPEPRLDLGKSLVGYASAAIDLSDGLALDLYRLCVASGVSAALEEVPVFRGATIAQALHGGEDYELLYTARKPAPGIRIGTIVEGKPGALVLDGRPLAPRGWDPFLRSKAPTRAAVR
jgi:thiamine-monophosphate kinase